MPTLHGPFAQLLPMTGLPSAGPLADEQLAVVPEAGLLVEGPLDRGGVVVAVGGFADLRRAYPGAQTREAPPGTTCLPGIIDAHTHLCWAGSRAADFALRNAGMSYLAVAAAGGGIRSTVAATRAADDDELRGLIAGRLRELRRRGITTVECKSGYGLTVAEELRHLRLISETAAEVPGVEVVPTCLAAHVCPPEFDGDAAGYLLHLERELLPRLAELPRRPRVDAFAEPSAFWGAPLERYLRAARAMGFDVTLHGDQFTPGGAALGCRTGAVSVDHLEHCDGSGIAALAASAKTDAPTVAVALPGASLGLGEPQAPARRLLDAGACLAIASDWNPGSAPQGRVLAQACTLAAAEKLSNAELLAGLTVRAARALRLPDRGALAPGMRADVSWWPTRDYREVTWRMGALEAFEVAGAY